MTTTDPNSDATTETSIADAADLAQIDALYAAADLGVKLGHAQAQDWLDETLTAEIKRQLTEGGSIAVVRFARELRAKHRSRKSSPLPPAEKKGESAR